MENNIKTSPEENRTQAEIKQKSTSLIKTIWPKLLLLFILVVIFLIISSEASVENTELHRNDISQTNNIPGTRKHCIAAGCFKLHLYKMIKIRNEIYFDK